MQLICITGIDGTGKSTLARNTVSALRRQGVDAVYVYGRTYPVISRALMALGRMTLLRRKNIWRDYHRYTSSKKQAMRNPVLVWAYTSAILTDYFVQVWLKLLPHLLARRVVVADRYVYDTVISDLAVHLNYTEKQLECALRRTLKLVPAPLLTVLIDVPPEVAFARKDDVPHVDYLRERREWYIRLARWPRVALLDGQRPPQELVQALLHVAQM